MQVLDNKEVANHVGPESCVTHREMRREALTGERIGQPLSHERVDIPGADAVQVAQGHTSEGALASTRMTRRGRRPGHVRTLHAREPGDLQFDRWRQYQPAARIGKARGAADKAADFEGCESPYRQLPGFGRLAYPLRGEVTNRDMRGRKSHGRPASQDARVGATGVASNLVGLNIGE